MRRDSCIEENERTGWLADFNAAPSFPRKELARSRKNRVARGDEGEEEEEEEEEEQLFILDVQANEQETLFCFSYKTSSSGRNVKKISVILRFIFV